jgi:aminoglycoside phosphotransferase (APT) family kinase protein
MFPRGDAGAYDRLRNELYAALTGSQWVSWIHGDLWPGNILIDPETHALAGLIDWDKAAAQELPLHDTLHLLLFTRKLVHQHGPADILAALGPGVTWTPAERSILDTAMPGSTPDRLPERVAVLLYWLRQTASTLTLLPSYAEDHDYVALNIDGVLRHL